MDEAIFGCLGLLILIGIPLAVLYAFVRLFKRVGRLEDQVETLAGRLDTASLVSAQSAAVVREIAEPEVLEAEPGRHLMPEPEPATEASADAKPVEDMSVDADASELGLPVPEDSYATPEMEAPETEASESAASGVEAPQIQWPPEESDPWWTGLEEKIWTRLPVWLGAIALALAAAYLVKFSLDRGWISAQVRVAAGVLGGIALLVGGDRLRRSSDYVAQGLAASGIAALFVSFWAATDLYELVPWWLGFALMALTTATAVLLSLRQGYLVAVLGLVGGFLTPALVSSDSARPWALFSYLLLLQIGLVIVSRRRAWGSLGVLTLGGGFVWLFAFLGGGFADDQLIWGGIFLLASIATFCFQYLGQGEESEGATLGGVAVSKIIGWGAFGGGLVAASALTFQGDFGPMEWGVLGLLSAGCYALARLDESYLVLAWLAALVATFQLAAWQTHIGDNRGGLFLGVHLALGALLAGAAWVFARGLFFKTASRFPGTWASLTTTVAVVHFLLLVEAESKLGFGDVIWGAFAVALGAVFVVGCLPFARLRHEVPGLEKPLAALAVGATIFFSLALPLELERQWLTVSWALEVAALLWLSGRLKVDALRHFAWLLAGGVGLRLLLNPVVLSYPIGTMPVINWLLYGYGIPAAAFLVAARWADEQSDGRLAETLRWLASGLTFALVTLQIRQYYQPGDLAADDVFFLEWATYLVAWSAMAWGCFAAASRFFAEQEVRQLTWGGRALAVLTVFLGSMSLGLAFNPLFHHEYVGEMPIANGLLWGYGVPAIFLLLVLRRLLPWIESKDRRYKVDGLLTKLLSVALLVDIFALVTLQVRHLFRIGTEHAGFLDRGVTSTAENYAYSIAWIVLGVALALLGRRSKTMRWGSLCVLLPATLKVFLYDTSELEGLWRVASLVGLGLSLMALAYFFQRFVFRTGLAAVDPQTVDRQTADPRTVDPRTVDSKAVDSETAGDDS